MKLFFKILKILVIVVLSALILVVGGFFILKTTKSNKNLSQLGGEAPQLSEKGHSFRDLNKNGSLDAYEDTRVDIDTRIEDLLSQMTLEEKAGTMFQTMVGVSPKGEMIDKPFFSTDIMDIMPMVMLPQGSDMVAVRLMNSFNILGSREPHLIASFNNHIQSLGERTRLGIPITLSTDPRHGTESNPGAAIYTPGFSQWPNSLGLAATRDTVLVREFGDIARQEYLATGIRLALHPMADLATEPRWARTNGTFGENAELSAVMTKAYILGFQGDSLGAHSVATMTKHFSGGGPQEDGEDAHFHYGKNQVYPGNNFDYHVIPFVEGAFPAGTAQIMPYYGVPIGQTSEDVAFGFNKDVIQGLLRDSLKFDGVVCTDWGIINDAGTGQARAWGVEELTPVERTKKALEAGVDQFGGEASPELVIELVQSGELSEERIDVSVRRILRDKFRLGLFDNPYVDAEAASKISGSEAFLKKGEIAQAKSTVLLKNEGILPLKKGTKVYVEGMAVPEAINRQGVLVDSPEEADVILQLVKTPFDPRNSELLENFFHQGRLYFTDEEIAHTKALAAQKPLVVVANIERPAILTDHDMVAQALVAEFGTSNEVLVDLLFGAVEPEGKMPFELPSTWEAVLNQLEDVPYDSKDPLYPYGHGLRY